MRITLKAARVNAGLSGPEAAEKLGISLWTLRRYERQYRVPSWDVANRIPDVYGIPLDNIILSPVLNKSEED